MPFPVCLLAASLGTAQGLAADDVGGRYLRVALQAAPRFQGGQQRLRVAAGRGGQSCPAGKTEMFGRFAEVRPQVAGRKMVGVGQADDEGPDAFAGPGPDLEGQDADVLVGHREDLGPRKWGDSAATSSGTAFSPALVIFSVPLKIASIAAPRIWWERAPIMPPVWSCR